MNATVRPSHHHLPVHEVVLLLGTDATSGLPGAEAAERLAHYGPNELAPPPVPGALRRLLGQLRSPLVYVLLASGAAAAGLGEVVDASVIFGVVVMNAVIGFVQETRARVALASLEAMVETEARVVRDGRGHRVPAADLVPGDLVLLEAGDRVPADLRVVKVAALQTDESGLTGESTPVAKDEPALPPSTVVADRRNMVYSGTTVTAGAGAGVVVATGAGTELGEVHRLVGEAEPLATPLTRKLDRFSRLLTVWIGGLAALAFAVGVARGEPLADMLVAAVALAVGAIPEALPAAVTVTLAVGVARMARRRAIVRRLPAVETLGSTTVICSDKTGTFTQNRMTVQSVWTAGGRYDIDDDPAVGADEALRWSLVAGALCNDAVGSFVDGSWRALGDPTDVAMQTAAARLGVAPDELARLHPRLATIPFDAASRQMATFHASDTEEIVLVKGAAEHVLARCRGQMRPDGSTAPLGHDAVVRANRDFTSAGMRVLATAWGRLPANGERDEASVSDGLLLTGLQALHDPPRPGAAAAVASCRSAGISVKMITGDHPSTARAIAASLGLGRRAGTEDGEGDGDEDGDGIRVLAGAELDALGAEELLAQVREVEVFARVSPEQKLRLVEALQALGEVVAMTGDGVNDAPALRQADIGVAMGWVGTAIAKEAADMVLTDDDFSTIEAAVEEGRGVFDNLTKFIAWTLPTNFAEGFVILVAVLLGSRLPILPVQILWINMTTAVALGLMLAFEPKEPGIMARPPRDPGRPLLTGSVLARIVLVSSLLVGGSWWLFTVESADGGNLAAARTAAIDLFVAVEAVYLFSCRTLSGPVRAIGLGSNRWVVVGVTVQAAGQLALTYVPAMNDLFRTAPIGPTVWVRIALFALIAGAVVELAKRWQAARPDDR